MANNNDLSRPRPSGAAVRMGTGRASLGLDSRGRLSLRNRCRYATFVRYNIY
jgi:hypothetical protein